jgi:hypothetical protein
MATLELTRTDLRKLMGHHLGYGRHGPWGPQKEQDIEDCIASGQRLFYFPEPLAPGGARHRWSFLWPETTLTLSAAQTSSTITVVSGVVTIAAGTWPTWAAQGELTPDSDSTYSVASRDSPTQLTLDDTSVDVDVGTEYTLGRVEYDMPSDFSGFAGPMVYRPGTSTAYDPIKFTSWGVIRRLRQLYGASTTRPTKACLVAKTLDLTATQGHKIIFDYQSNSAYVLYYKYKVNPDALDAANLYAAGGPDHSETLLAACVYAADRSFSEDPERIERSRQTFLTRLAASIADDEDQSPDTVGQMRDPGMDEPRVGIHHHGEGSYVHYEGVRYS